MRALNALESGRLNTDYHMRLVEALCRPSRAPPWTRWPSRSRSAIVASKAASPSPGRRSCESHSDHDVHFMWRITNEIYEAASE